METTRRQFHNPPIDRGWAWAIMFAAAAWNFIVSGTMKSFGVLYVEFLELYNTTPSETGWIGFTFSIMMMLLAPLSGYLCDRLSARWLSIVCAIIASCGIFMTGLVPSLPWTVVTYGIIAGGAAAVTDGPVFGTLNKYFRKRRALANSVAFIGSGVGCLCFPLIFNWTIGVFTLRGAMFILAGVWLHGCVVGCVLRPIEPHVIIIEHVIEDEGFADGSKLECDEVLEGDNLIIKDCDKASQQTTGTPDLVCCKDIDESIHECDETCNFYDNCDNTINNSDNDIGAEDTSCDNIGPEPILPAVSVYVADNGDTNSKYTIHESIQISVQQSTPPKTCVQNHNHTLSDLSLNTSAIDSCICDPTKVPYNCIYCLQSNKGDSNVLKVKNNLSLSLINIDLAHCQDDGFSESDALSFCPPSPDILTTIRKRSAAKSAQYPTLGQIAKHEINEYCCFLRNGPLIRTVCAIMLACIAYYNQMFLFPPYAEELGLSKLEGSLLVSIPGITEILSRLIIGFIGDHRYCNKVYLVTTCSFVTSLLGLVVTFIPSRASMFAFSVATGLMGGTHLPLAMPIIADTVPVERLGSATGLFLWAIGMGFAVGPPGLGYIKEATGSYAHSFRVCVLFYWPACVLFTWSLIADTFRRNTKKFRKTSVDKDNIASTVPKVP